MPREASRARGCGDRDLRAAGQARIAAWAGARHGGAAGQHPGRVGHHAVRRHAGECDPPRDPAANLHAVGAADSSGEEGKRADSDERSAHSRGAPAGVGRQRQALRRLHLQPQRGQAPHPAGRARHEPEPGEHPRPGAAARGVVGPLRRAVLAGGRLLGLPEDGPLPPRGGLHLDAPAAAAPRLRPRAEEQRPQRPRASLGRGLRAPPSTPPCSCCSSSAAACRGHFGLNADGAPAQ
mmetsp:Transcript_85057/g.230461  ORF Transcript_85057/g.230461 Transcript_85057/m.230461 type:complete len:237 (+) Transcript_85057:124-834(+)